MEIGNNNKDNNTEDILDAISKKVEIKYIKAGKDKRTYIYGLTHFMPDKKEREKLVKQLKCDLGSGGVIRNDEQTGEEKIGMTGNHSERIAKILIEKYNIPAQRIVILI